MKIKYYNGIGEHVEVVNDLYRDVATLLAAESIDHPTEVKVTNCLNPDELLKYRISARFLGTRFIVELDNTMPDRYLPDHEEPVSTCVDPNKNAYKFYKLEKIGSCVRASYGRMGVQKGKLFGERNFDYPLSMFWIKYYEKLSKGYVDRTDLYLADESEDSKSQNVKVPVKTVTDVNVMLFNKLKSFAVNAVKKAEVRVPVTTAILKKSDEILNAMRNATDVTEFNKNLLELISYPSKASRNWKWLWESVN